MKATLFAALLTVTLLPFASHAARSQSNGVSGQQIAEMLSSDAAQKLIANQEISSIHASLTSKATTVTATITIETQGSDLGMQGPQGVPCTVILNQVSVGGFAGTTTGPVQADQICAAAGMQ